jgi:hypothetical protein
MIHFAPIKNDLIRTFLLIIILFLLPLCLIDQVQGQVATTQSGYNLIGTIRSGGFSGAVINVAKGEQSFFRLFEKLPDGSRIVQVRDDSISIKGTDGTLYDMFISHEKTLGFAAPPPSNNYSSVNVSSPTPATALTNTSTNHTIARTRRRDRY